jgi:geranylgeranyl reductase family protein
MRGSMAADAPLDVVVVGAGPAGLRTAELLSGAGLEVLVLEEHREVGRPVQCAGLLSTRVFKLLGSEFAIENRVSGARVHVPDGRTIAFDAGHTRALVVDRAAFDKELAARAARAGAGIRLGCRVTAVHASASGCVLEARDLREGQGSSSIELRARAVVGADGPGSLVRRSIGRPRPRQALTAFQLRFATAQALDTSVVNLFAGHEIAPGFFAWVIPLSEHQGLIGLASEPGGPSPRERMDTLLRDPRFTQEFSEPRPMAAYVGKLPLGPIPRPVADGALLVGDAAAQPKATSGGGVYPALEASAAAAEALVAALEKGEPTAKALMAYPRAFDEVVGDELRRAARLRRSYRAMSEKMVNDLAAAVDDPELLRLIVLEGDIDFPSKLVKALLHKSPSLLKLAGPILKGFF